MELILLVLQSVVVFALLIFTFISTKQRKYNQSLLEHEVQKLSNSIVENQEKLSNKNHVLFQSFTESVQDNVGHHLSTFEEKAHEKLSQAHQDNTDILHRVGEQTSNDFNQMINNFSQKLDEELKINQQKINDWISYVDSLSATEEKVEALESSINKYPYSKDLVLKYVADMGPLLSSDNKLVYKRALERLNKVARTFLDNCDVTDYSTAINLYNDVIARGKQFMKTSYDTRIEDTKQKLKDLEQKVTEIEKGDSSSKKVLISELEDMENNLDKQLIQKVNALKVRYHNLSKRIIDVLAQENDEDKVKEYNLNAISSLELMHSKLNMDPKLYRSGRIPEIARVLGEWDTSYFTPQTNMYYQFIYKEVFDNLDPSEKPKLTEQVLRLQKKKVS